MSLTHDIAKQVVELRSRDIPEFALEKAKLAIRDTIGVTIAGAGHEGSVMLRKMLQQTAGPGSVLVYGTDIRLNVLDAALLNGAASHMLDYDDATMIFLGHISVAILPAILAKAEEIGASGDDVLRAFIIGYEVCTGIASSVAHYQYTHGHHTTATIGIFGAIAGVGTLMELTAEEFVTAFGIAASMAAGLKCNIGSWAKPLAVGQSARNAILAANLAREGFTSTPEAFEHRFGYLNAFHAGPENYDATKITKGWGDPFVLASSGFMQKRFPCCYGCIPPVDAIEAQAQKHGIKAENVERIEVAVNALRMPHTNIPDPRTPQQARFSMYYCVARHLIDGELRLEAFEGDAFLDANVRELMAKISYVPYDHDYIGGADVKVWTKDGRLHETNIVSNLGGSYDNPLPETMVRKKFADAAGRVIDGAGDIYDLLANHPSLPAPREFAATLEAAAKAGVEAPQELRAYA